MTGCSSAPGVIPRAVSDIFSMIETTTNIENDVYFYIRLSYVELYNNQFRNLLEFASKELSMKAKADISSSSQNSKDESTDTSLNTSVALRRHHTPQMALLANLGADGDHRNNISRDFSSAAEMD